MGFLQIAGGGLDIGVPNFSKAVFSFWFRIPAASIAAANAQFVSINPDSILESSPDNPYWESSLLGMLPLVVFGPNPIVSTSGGSFGDATSHTSPCFIGVNCGPKVQTNYDGDMTASRSLCAHFAYDNDPFTVHFEPSPITWHYQNRFQIGYSPGFGTFFNTGPYFTLDGTSITVSADRWHHLLLSFDFSGTGACPFYWAFDDVDRSDMTHLWPDAAGDHSIYPANGALGANGSLSVSSHPYGIPATSENVDFVYMVEMAEFQMFTDVICDTSIVGNRRAFVGADGKPASPVLSEALLEKPPEIMLQGTSAHWKAGVNTGVMGANFDVTGSIVDYANGPTLV
jgi:hypothetical protein